jgi:hypothetical protein
MYENICMFYKMYSQYVKASRTAQANEKELNVMQISGRYDVFHK